QGGAAEEGELHLVLVDLAGAEDAGVRPDRHAVGIRRLAPLRLLDDIRIRRADHLAHALERREAPVVLRRGALATRPCGTRRRGPSLLRRLVVLPLHAPTFRW